MNKVQAGQPLEIKASTWNAFIDAAEIIKNQQQNEQITAKDSGIRTGIVLVQNSESTLAGRFTALMLTGILVTPAKNEGEFVSRPPAFTGKRMGSTYVGYPYAILLEPIMPGKIGKAMLLGTTPAQVNILNATHQYAEPTSSGSLQSAETGVARLLWKAGNSGTQWCMLLLGGAGSGSGGDSVLCQIEGGSSGSYSVTLYGDGKNSGPTGTGTLFVPDIALGAQIPSGTWVIGHKQAMKITGGNDK